MAEWIEMFCHMILKKGGAVSASDGGVDWNRWNYWIKYAARKSPLAMAEWIEIFI